MKLLSRLQEGAILPEIISRLTTIYGSGRVDIVAVSLFLQDLGPHKPLGSELLAETADSGSQSSRIKDEDEIEDTRVGEFNVDGILSDDGGDEPSNGDAEVKESVAPLTRSRKGGSEPKLREFKSRRKAVCSHCNKVTVNKYTLDTHITICHPEACQACEKCGKKYGLAELLAKHVRLKHDTTPRVTIDEAVDGAEPGLAAANHGMKTRLGWQCPDCDKVFKSKKSQELHSYHHAASGEKMFECDLCGKKLRNPVTLEKHMDTFHNETGKLFVCAQCDEKFSARSLWKEHLRLHGPVCRRCQAVFPSEAELKLHVPSCQKVPAAELGSVRCEYCGNTYSSEGVLKHHIKRVHLKELNFLCDKCEQKFSSKADLKKHVLARHEPERQGYVCDACGKAYASASNLRNHIAYEHHNKEKPFACDICSSRFAYQPEMLRHRERHASQPQHGCPHCDKKFVTKSDMLRHKKVVHENYHVGSCDICGR
jgi:KRAB domain-containing zinc finger protein